MTQRANLSGYETQIGFDIQAGKAGSVAVLELDRSCIGGFGGKLRYDCVLLFARIGIRTF